MGFSFQCRRKGNMKVKNNCEWGVDFRRHDICIYNGIKNGGSSEQLLLSEQWTSEAKSNE
jgi:hypothetical protein